MDMENVEDTAHAENARFAVRRAQVYLFLSTVFLYPQEDWLDSLFTLSEIGHELNIPPLEPAKWDLDLEGLQSEHRRVMGLTGSLCYETEYGLPHEFRHSQELADIAGFYNAFGFSLGGAVRERPDHLAVEFEFLYLLSLKEAYALQKGTAEQAEICVDARRGFLRDHIGQWLGLFAESLAHTAPNSVYTSLARFAVAFVRADATDLGVTLEERRLVNVKPTPLGPEMSCQDCVATETLRQEKV
jgi:putative dimethyl sulfoxide reductase chaperone